MRLDPHQYVAPAERGVWSRQSRQPTGRRLGASRTGSSSRPCAGPKVRIRLSPSRANFQPYRVLDPWRTPVASSRTRVLDQGTHHRPSHSFLTITHVNRWAQTARSWREDQARLQISEFPTGDFGSKPAGGFGGNRQAVSVQSGTRCGWVLVPTLANRRCVIHPILLWSAKASTLVIIIVFSDCCGRL